MQLAYSPTAALSQPGIGGSPLSLLVVVSALLGIVSALLGIVSVPALLGASPPSLPLAGMLGPVSCDVGVSPAALDDDELDVASVSPAWVSV
jgi:hypothetical protein